MWWIPVLVMSTFGVNLALWATVGAIRVVTERTLRRRASDPSYDQRHRVQLSDVAVMIPAHNEALVIEATIDEIVRLVDPSQVHVISDGSSDATAALAHAKGVHVLENVEPMGKARALKAGIEHFDLTWRRFEAVLLLDADTRLDDDYFKVALPYFDDPEVCAVAGCAASVWKPTENTTVANVLIAHRDRMYYIFQRFVKYGQCSKYANVTPIIPGFASLYSTRILDQVRIDEPGLVIEDFNMTFEVHHGHLGRIEFDPRAKAYTLDPHRVSDYRRQVKRWSLGFWQTVRRHGIWAGKFWAALALMMVELLTSSVSLFVGLIAFISLVLGDIAPAVKGFAGIGPVLDYASSSIGYKTLLIGIFLPDYFLTCVAAVMQRRPRYLLLGLAFIPVRIIDAAAVLTTLPRAWLVESTGRWTSPQRQGATAEGPPDDDGLDPELVPELEPRPDPRPELVPVGAPAMAGAFAGAALAPFPTARPQQQTVPASAPFFEEPLVEFSEPDVRRLVPAAALYLADAYEDSFYGSVVDVDVATHSICTDRTAFQPADASRAADAGWLGGARVLDVRTAGGAVWHQVDRSSALPAPGNFISGMIDWPARYGHMRATSALALFRGVANQAFGVQVDMDQTQIRPLRLRVDIVGEPLPDDFRERLEAQVNAEIAAALPIGDTYASNKGWDPAQAARGEISWDPSLDGRVRVIEINGFERIADRGSHVQSTREIGSFEIVKTRPRPNGHRLWIRLT